MGSGPGQERTSPECALSRPEVLLPQEQGFSGFYATAQEWTQVSGGCPSAASHPLDSCGLQVCDPASCLGLFSEKYNPPANLTVQDNVSHFVIRWDAPAMRYSLSNSVLRYALDIQKMVRT